MAEVDTSSYAKPPAMAADKSMLDTAQQLGTMEQQKVSIDQSKLKLMNERWQMINSQLSTLIDDPDVAAGTKESSKKVINAINDFSKLAQLPDDMRTHFISSVPTNPAKIRDFLRQTQLVGADNITKVNLHYGDKGYDENGQQRTPITFSARNGIKQVGLPVQMQPPVTTPTLNKKNEPELYGAQPPALPEGTVAAPGGLPGQFIPTPAPRPALPVAPPVGPLTAPAIPGPSSNFGGTVTGATAEQPTFSRRFAGEPTGPRTGQAPGEADAQAIEAKGSAEQLIRSRALSNNYRRDVFPLEEAIPALEKLGTKGTGPGTETFQHIKSFILSNVPGVKESDFNGTVADADKAKKYLTDFVNQTGSSGTNDKLAAAFAGNPSVNISNAAAIDVAKSALALRKMQQAQQLTWDNLKPPLLASQFGKWATKWNESVDPRAFGVDYLSKDAADKLYKELNKKGNEKQKEKFEQTLKFAHEAELIRLK